jgi:signal peptidase I
MTQQDIATRAPTARQPKRRAGRIVFWALVGLALAVLLASIAFPVLTINLYLEQSTSMQPTIAPGDRILAVQGSSGIRRGDIVVFRVPTKISGTDDLFMKRVIGLPGDHVACCDARGQVTVDGKPLSENYLYPGDPPSRTRFSVTVGKGKIWVMGDHRNISVDSREWGPVPVRGVVGRVILIGHGSSFATVRTPRTFVADGLAPVDTRLRLYAGIAIAAAASIVALLLLAAFGITRFVIRRRGRGASPVGAGPPSRPLRPLLQPLYGVYRVPLGAVPKPRPAEKKPSPAEQPSPANEQPARAEDKPGPANENPTPDEEKPSPADEQPAPDEEKPSPADEQPAPDEEKPSPADEPPAPEQDKPSPAVAKPDPAKAAGGS